MFTYVVGEWFVIKESPWIVESSIKPILDHPDRRQRLPELAIPYKHNQRCLLRPILAKLSIITGCARGVVLQFGCIHPIMRLARIPQHLNLL